MINQNVYQSSTKQLTKHQPPIMPSTEPKTYRNYSVAIPDPDPNVLGLSDPDP